MPPRVIPPLPQRGSFSPPSDAATYRDLLFFEERLKTNAASLKRRKTRYQFFLIQLVIVIVFLLSDFLFDTTFLVLPLNVLIRLALAPEHENVLAPPYVTAGLLFVAVMTLVLFYASGMYSEKIGYANRYVPHANRALRYFNMYLNVRPPPLQTQLIPFSSFFFRGSNPLPPSPTTPNAPKNRSNSPTRLQHTVLPPIPPTTNPRGELIFSSRVDRSFREAYEKYRLSFEKKREETRRTSRKGVMGWIPGFDTSRPPTPTGKEKTSGSSPPTPSGSRRSSPAPGSKGSRRGKGKSRSGTPLSEIGEIQREQEQERERTESFNFLLGQETPPIPP